MMNKVLFICTGNYYRSRFAEEYFNYKAKILQINWSAYSKGLSENMPSLNNPGSISVHTKEALTARKIEGKGLHRFPEPLIPEDLERYNTFIALSELEHKPMLEKRFPEFLPNIEYAEIGDLPVETPKEAITKIEKLVDDLIARFQELRPELNEQR